MGDTVPDRAPLAGRRVVTTRGAAGEDRLRALLEAAGARVMGWPTCEYPPPRDPGPLEAARARLDRFDWVVFTSARAVAAVGEGGANRATTSVGGPTPTPRVAVVGPATARAAAEAGWTVAVEGRGPGARGLAAQVAVTFPVAGARVLFPAASGAVSTVEEEFTALGARITRVEAYRTVVAPPPAAVVRADLAAGVDAVTFASPAAVEAVVRALDEAANDAPPVGVNRALAGEEARSAPEARGRTPGRPGGPGPAGEMARALAGVVVVCIGPTTGEALARRGVDGVQVAAASTLEAMVDALVERFGGADADCGRTPTSSAAPFRPAGRSDAARGGARRSQATRGRATQAGGRRSEVTRSEVTRSEVTRSESTRNEATRNEATRSEATSSEATRSGATRSGARRRPGRERDTSGRPNARAAAPAAVHPPGART